MVTINTEICRKSRENVEKMSRITLGNFPDFFLKMDQVGAYQYSGHIL